VQVTLVRSLRWHEPEAAMMHNEGFVGPYTWLELNGLGPLHRVRGLSARGGAA